MKSINFKKAILALSITIVLNIFFNMGISAFYKEPQYDNFCKNINYYTQASCEAAGHAWLKNGVAVNPTGGVVKPAPTVPVAAPDNSTYYCDQSVYQNKCNTEFQSVLSVYNRNVFIVLIVLGIASIVGGFFFERSGAVSLGLSLGGVLSLLIGTIRYWSSMQEFLRFAVSGVALVALIWLGVKKFGENKEEPKHEGV